MVSKKSLKKINKYFFTYNNQRINELYGKEKNKLLIEKKSLIYKKINLLLIEEKKVSIGV